LRFYGDIIQRYLDFGWDIQVVNVGAAVNSTVLARNVKYLFDDNHHPGCNGVHLISDLIQHAIYTNLAATCPTNPPALPTEHFPIPAHKEILGDVSPQWNDLWTDLFRHDARIGSYTPWKPTANITDLHLANRQAIDEFETYNLGKSSIFRTDRKPGYIIPSCKNASTPPINFVLDEPDLKWIGLSHDMDNTLRVSINNMTVKVKDDASWNIAGKVWFRQWIHLPTRKVPQADSYTLTLCKRVDAFVGLLHIVAVMLPPNTTDANSTAAAALRGHA